MIVTLRDQDRVKPTSVDGIDWSDPLAVGLRTLCLCNEGSGVPFDLVHGPLAGADDFTQGTPGTWSSGNMGPSVRDFAAPPQSCADTAFVNGPWSVACWCRVDNLTAARQPNPWGQFNYVSETNNQGWFLGGGTGSNGKWCFYTYRNTSSATYALNGGSNRKAGDNFIVGTTDGTTRRLYVNGRLEASTTNNANAILNTTNGISNSSDLEQTPLYIGYAWSRCLTPNEINELLEEPYRVLLVPTTRRWFVPPQSAGGSQNLTRTLSDSPSTSESITRTLILARTLSDSPSTGDSLTRALVLTRTCADSSSTSDSLARAGTFARTGSDNPTVASTATRAGTFSRTSADSPSATDSLARAVAFARTATDAPSTSDNVTQSQTLARTATGAPSTADSVVRVESLTRTGADNPTVASTATRAGTFVRTTGDSPSTADSPVAVAGKIATCADSPNTADALVRVGTFARLNSDSAFTTDSLVRAGTFLRAANDAPQTADSAAGVLPFQLAADRRQATGRSDNTESATGRPAGTINVGGRPDDNKGITGRPPN